MKRYYLLAAMLFFLTDFALAQFFLGSKVLDFQVLTSQEKIQEGDTFDLALVLDIKPGLHINSNTPTEEFLIQTIVKFNPNPNLSFGKISYPEPEFKAFAFSEETLSVYERKVIIFASIQVVPELESTFIEINGALSYQGCNDNTCFAPTSDSFKVILDVVPAGTEMATQHADIFAQMQKSEKLKVETSSLTADELRAQNILERGLIYAIVAFFIIGLTLNLTPCVYPVIPITVSYFGGQSGRSKRSILVTALFYMIGIAISFALLGLASGLAGKQWGFLFQSPWFVVVITTIILLMAASMFGAFEIVVPSFLLTKLGSAREGLIGSFIMGLTVGVIIAPCAAGIIIGLVGLVAKLELVFKGTLLFFIMGLGLGLPYLILATFSGLLDRLPQSGMWMIWIKKVFGFLLLGVALYFLVPQVERIYDKLYFFYGILGIVGGLLLGFLGYSGGESRDFKWFKRLAGGLLIILGILLTRGAINSQPPELDWKKFTRQTGSEIQMSEKPIFMDFYADWCAPCKQLDRETFSDLRVVELSKSFYFLKIDCTKPDEATRAFMGKYGVSGMPTLIFLKSSGEEIKELREIGFVGPAKFIKSMEKALE